jgi:hypothetical protein
MFYFHHSFTAAAWVRLTSSGSPQTILSRDKNLTGTGSAGDENLVSWNVQNDGTIYAGIYNGSTLQVEHTTTGAAIKHTFGEWEMLAIILVYDYTGDRKSTLTFFVNES